MRRRSQLRQRFGPEYERAVERSDSRKGAEQELAATAQQRDELEIRELSPESRARWSEQWGGVQARFVDAPGDAVAAADSMITLVLREQGYPVDDFDRRASLISVDHPEVVEHYREAHAAHSRHLESQQGDTEDLRQSFVHYRALFASLVNEEDDAGAPVTREDDADTPARHQDADADDADHTGTAPGRPATPADNEGITR
jgi:hypothetical protein